MDCRGVAGSGTRPRETLPNRASGIVILTERVPRRGALSEEIPQKQVAAPAPDVHQPSPAGTRGREMSPHDQGQSAVVPLSARQLRAEGLEVFVDEFLSVETCQEAGTAFDQHSGRGFQPTDLDQYAAGRDDAVPVACRSHGHPIGSLLTRQSQSKLHIVKSVDCSICHTIPNRIAW